MLLYELDELDEQQHQIMLQIEVIVHFLHLRLVDDEDEVVIEAIVMLHEIVEVVDDEVLHQIIVVKQTADEVIYYLNDVADDCEDIYVQHDEVELDEFDVVEQLITEVIDELDIHLQYHEIVLFIQLDDEDDDILVIDEHLLDDDVDEAYHTNDMMLQHIEVDEVDEVKLADVDEHDISEYLLLDIQVIVDII